MSDGYNGWSNYETWCVALWLDNEEGSYNEMLDLAKSVNNTVEGTHWLEGQIKDLHEEAMPVVTGVFADLLNASLSEVDWYEIATHYMETAHEEADAS